MYVSVSQRPPFLVSEPSARLRVQGVSPSESPLALTFRIEAASNAIPANAAMQRVELFNFRTNTYETADERAPTGADSVVEVTFDSDAGRFVEPGTRQMRARIGIFDRGVLLANWGIKVDHAAWAITP